MIEGTFPGGRVDPIGVAPAEVVAQAVRCELLEAVAEAARMMHEEAGGRGEARAWRELGTALAALDAALVAAGATGKAGT